MTYAANHCYGTLGTSRIERRRDQSSDRESSRVTEHRNAVQVTKRQQVLSLLELGWTYRRIEAETGLRRETVARYDRLRRANAAKVFPSSAPPTGTAAVGATGGDG
jgi:hypothetical protein